MASVMVTPPFVGTTRGLTDMLKIRESLPLVKIYSSIVKQDADSEQKEVKEVFVR